MRCGPDGTGKPFEIFDLRMPQRFEVPGLLAAEPDNAR